MEEGFDEGRFYWNWVHHLAELGSFAADARQLDSGVQVLGIVDLLVSEVLEAADFPRNVILKEVWLGAASVVGWV